MKNSIKKINIYLLFLVLLFSSSLKKRIPKRFLSQENESRTAYDVYAELQEASTSFNAKALFVADDLSIEGMEAGVTYGAEKEASSSLITRVMSPPRVKLSKMISSMPEGRRKEFLSNFLSEYMKDNNGYRTSKNEYGVFIDYAKNVVDIDGNPKKINLETFKGIDYYTASLELLEEKWDLFLSMTDDRPLSFIKPSIRRKMFLGKLPGMNNKFRLKEENNFRAYSDWKPLFGKAQKYISGSHAHRGGATGGWELNFIPQQTYGEFEEMIVWFRTELKSSGKLFQAPGHQRMVFRRHINLNEKKLAELYRAIQALIIVEGIQGKTGIENSKYKAILTDSKITSLSSQRGVIRLEGSRWARDTIGIEFRAGTKDIKLSRFYQSALAARVATNDFSGMSEIGEYKLFDGASNSPESLAIRFDVPVSKAKKALEKLRIAGIKPSFVIAFWHWEGLEVPFVGKTKKKFIKSLTKDFILQVASLSRVNIKKNSQRLLQSWVKGSKLSDDIRNYIRPKKMIDDMGDPLYFSSNVLKSETTPRVAQNFVNVNDIDLGIEYTGKFPLKLDAEFTNERLPDGNKAWLKTRIDLTMGERKAILKKIANDLAEEFGSPSIAEEVLNEGGHGHGLEIAYTIRDLKNRKWRVEWDGIGRSYSETGEVVDGSVRSGSIELVTPKFVPEIKEIQAIFRTFNKNNIIPSVKAGGGHINVDLEPFVGRPKALARFVSIFLEHRGILSLMYQYVNRLKSAEPIEIDSGLAHSLKNFEGTEEELKKILYNKHYFNNRYGRKTRYNQLDISAYFQDVIPKRFLTADFDLYSPQEEWRRTFRADPKIRKAEFRLFNAPRDALESSLQIKLVRAMLHKALNEDGELSGTVQKVDHLAYLDNPEKAYKDLESLCDALGLNKDEYRPAVAEGLSDTDMTSRSVFFESLEEKLKNFPKQRGWGKAVNPRSDAEAISSEGRTWIPGPEDQLNTMTHEKRILSAREAARKRRKLFPFRENPGDFVRSTSCVDAAGAFL